MGHTDWQGEIDRRADYVDKATAWDMIVERGAERKKLRAHIDRLSDELRNLIAICSMAAPEHNIAIERARAAIALATTKDAPK